MNTAPVVPESPSARLISATEMEDPSSSVMVTVPCVFVSVTFVGFVRFTTNVSSASSTVSGVTGTEIVFVTSPVAKVSVPEVAV